VTIAIETRGLSKTYGTGAVAVNVVMQVDLQIHEGQVIGLFGPSGSGKTTLLSMLGCLLRPTEGALRLYDTEITGLQEKDLPQFRKKYVSFIFQGFNLFPALTVFENILLALHVKGERGAGAEKTTRNILEEVGLTDRSNFLPRDLSGGQKQRVSIGRALATASPVILADEPTANLDHTNGRKVMNMLRDLATQRSKCVIVATHDIRIADLFDQILQMEDGQIIKREKVAP
jgi:putative ABC transport system ATP-binding protein